MNLQYDDFDKIICLIYPTTDLTHSILKFLCSKHQKQCHSYLNVKMIEKSSSHSSSQNICIQSVWHRNRNSLAANQRPPFQFGYISIQPRVGSTTGLVALVSSGYSTGALGTCLSLPSVITYCE
ncbi:hypothetical protein Bhyg_03615 [Pseudolycoriella hygida]|uniref:Uncharacterized protein n=1 Tax=Pseudolycoriella hygida TaxID=35572 RepID=A0A9Q0NEE1_9DIPT|nr:hypothetical protein Bhyg_03615 [Pseudolycoriella hygida]